MALAWVRTLDNQLVMKYLFGCLHLTSICLLSDAISEGTTKNQLEREDKRSENSAVRLLPTKVLLIRHMEAPIVFLNRALPVVSWC